MVMVGPPGSGKTYFSRPFAENNGFIRVNSDDTREAMFAQPDYSKEEREQVYQKMGETVEEALQSGKEVILDGNFLSNGGRQAVLDRFKPYGQVVFVVLAINLKESLAQAIKRGNPADPLYEQHITEIYNSYEPIDPAWTAIKLIPSTYEQMEMQFKKDLSATLKS